MGTGWQAAIRLGAVSVAFAVAGCQAVADVPVVGQLGATTPRAVVGKTLAALVDHDLAAANSYTCAEGRIPDELPLPLNVRFGLAHLPDLTAGDALSVVDLDLSGLEAQERLVDDTEAQVDLRGEVIVHYDLAKVRALAMRTTQGRDPATVDTVLAILGDGELKTSLNTTVQLTKPNGSWLICGATGIFR
ncbi:MAG: hypothetical protein ABIR11_07205 [Candidatus Limnocylindrales bacterium]